ncbi:hypothetical protein N657DRAFT_635697 [Parathielavia appendiculata]|uniref:Uncharacterized protein n=1 Tax=Parathielavia appendiculata TaxID=2587402 RepID=A0AAN6TXJ7_9PEZI|nr:hypothetical protein N657DRAFT_635697 [Parathielavia appendiculata]
MPRQLPWKVGGVATKQTSSRPKPAASLANPAPSHPVLPTPKPKSEPTSNLSRKRRRSLALTSGTRSPSTSPPPEPHKEEFMIEGMDHDDQYRMVEDEFLAVAGEFTRHLHAAEYQRLKGLAKSQNAEAIQNISRPVTGKMTDLVKRRHAALNTASSQRKGIAKVWGKPSAGNGSMTGDEKEPSHRPATLLQGLMDSPRKQTVLLTSVMTGARASSGHRDAVDVSPSRRRLNAGFVRSNSLALPERKHRVPSVRLESEPAPDSDDDDDLDAQPFWPRKPEPRRPEPDLRLPSKRASTQLPPTRTRSEPSDARNPFLKIDTARLPPLAQQSSESKEKVSGNDKDEEYDDPLARIRARRAEQKRRRETKVQDGVKELESQAAALNSIPFI